MMVFIVLIVLFLSDIHLQFCNYVFGIFLLHRSVETTTLKNWIVNNTVHIFVIAFFYIRWPFYLKWEFIYWNREFILTITFYMFIYDLHWRNSFNVIDRWPSANLPLLLWIFCILSKQNIGSRAIIQFHDIHKVLRNRYYNWNYVSLYEKII